MLAEPRALAPAPAGCKAMGWGHDPELGPPAWGQKESSEGDKLGFRGPWVCVSLPHGTEEESEAGSSGMAKESCPSLTAYSPSPGHGPTHRSSRQSSSPHGTCTYGTPQRAPSAPHRPNGGSLGGIPSLLHPQTQPCLPAPAQALQHEGKP